MRKLLVIAMLVLITACGYTFQHKPVDSLEAELMPEKVAKGILLGYFSAEWVEMPFATCCNLLGQSGKYPMGYAEITSIGSVAGTPTTVYFLNRIVTVREIPQGELQKVGLALRSLGATKLTSVSLGQRPAK
jgi:hypothetical protein